MAEIRADDVRRRAPRFDVGDRVIATHPLGGFWRPRVPRGTPGVIVSRSANGAEDCTVAFTNGRREAASEDALAEPSTPPAGPD